MGDFTGFTFNGKHSSEFNILRVSDGSRYQEDLVPDFSDVTEDRPEGPGSYYYGMAFKNREFSINIAYDNISEMDKRRLKHWLYPDGDLHYLIFDEKPYIKYLVKTSQSTSLKELCFLEEGQRCYKGDGNIKFTAYMPWGIVVDKDLNYYKDYENLEEWKESSGLKDLTKFNINYFTKFKLSTDSKSWSIPIYNPGDVDSPFKLTFHKKGFYNKLLRQSTDFETGSYYNLAAGTDTAPFFIFYLGEPRILSSDDNFASASVHTSIDTTSDVIFTGYFENDPFTLISNVDGETYQLYTAKTSSAKCIKYKNLGNYLDITVNYQFYVLNSTTNSFTYYRVQCTNYDTTTNIVTLAFEDDVEFSNISENLYVPFVSTSPIYKISVGTDFFTLKFPNAGITNPQFWTETQKASYYDCDIIIDTTKQTIEYNINPDNQRNVGIAGIVNSGALFNIPIDIDYSANNYNSFTIYINDSTLGKYLSNINIDYPYLYK